MSTVIKATKLRKSFKQRGNRNMFTGLWRPDWQEMTAVDKVSFEVNAGESVAFLGPNGAGKTTTTKMLTGLIYPTSGEIEVLGYEPSQRESSFLHRIGLVMGNRSGLNWDLTANQSFWLLKNIYQIDDKTFERRVNELSAMLKVNKRLDTQMRRVSLGERMKLELIGAILHNPDILFLDEPTIGLDIESKKNVREFLRRIQSDNGTTLVLTSHDMDDVEKVCDRVLVINEGKIVYDNPLANLVKHYNRTRYLRFHFREPVKSEQLREFGRVIDETKGVLLKVPSTNMVDVLSKLPEKFRVDDINIESIPLETIIGDIFEGKWNK